MPRGRPKKQDQETIAEATDQYSIVDDSNLDSPRGVECAPGVDNSIGPILFSRDQYGLLKNVQYQFNDDGSVNWRAMIKEEHLFPNRSWFEMRKKDLPTSIEGLDDNQLLIKLSGIKELAKLRGFKNITYKFQKCEHDHVAVTCGISFIKNYETDGDTIYFEDAANATLDNTSSFATKFLETIACNRAFVRCVRNFLNIHIVGDDEIDKSDTKRVKDAASNTSLSPSSILQSTANQLLGISSFDQFKDALRKMWSKGTYKNQEAANWHSFEDVPTKDCRKIIAILKSESFSL
jgi:hypothetical protein